MPVQRSLINLLAYIEEWPGYTNDVGIPDKFWRSFPVKHNLPLLSITFIFPVDVAIGRRLCKHKFAFLKARTYNVNLYFGYFLLELSFALHLQVAGTPGVLCGTWACAHINPGLAVLDTREAAGRRACRHWHFVVFHIGTVTRVVTDSAVHVLV